MNNAFLVDICLTTAIQRFEERELHNPPSRRPNWNFGFTESETDEVGIEKVSYPTQKLIFTCADAFAFKMNESLKIEIFSFENGLKMDDSEVKLW